MNSIIKHIIFFFLFVALCTNLEAQVRCGADEYYEHQKITNPGIIKNRQIQEELTAAFIKKGGSKQIHQIETVVYNIPVVVHVLWNSLETIISTQQVESQLTVLNKDFQLLNDDRNLTPSVFLDERANCQISFCLAKKDPNGNPTTGIIYKQTTRSYFIDILNDAKLSILGGDDIWDRDSYLNIWVVPKLLRLTPLGAELPGSTSFPGGPAATDGGRGVRAALRASARV